MKPWTFICPDLPNTKPCRISAFDTTDLFAATNCICTVQDPDGTLKTALEVFATDLADLQIQVSNDKAGYAFRDARLFLIEYADDGDISVMFASHDVKSFPLD